jgi:hypothetical protein
LIAQDAEQIRSEALDERLRRLGSEGRPTADASNGSVPDPAPSSAEGPEVGPSTDLLDLDFWETRATA